MPYVNLRDVNIYVGCYMASKYPEKVKSLITIGGAAYARPDGADDFLVKGGGHRPHFVGEQIDEVNSVMLAFLDRTNVEF